MPGSVDQQFLTDLYDVAIYYAEQLKRLDLKSYNGLSNEHKSVHRIALNEITTLSQLMKLFLENSHFVTRTSQHDEHEKIVHLSLTHYDPLSDWQTKLLSKYKVTMSLSKLVDYLIVIKLKLAYNRLEEEAIIQKPLGMEIVYTVGAFRTHIAPFLIVDRDGVSKNYQLVAPMITNYQDKAVQTGKGEQDAHLYVPDLYTRVLDLASKVDFIYAQA